MDALVPAFNEESTVAGVVRVLRAAGIRVLVVDDGSADRTAERAYDAGADVLQMVNNRGKAEAMLAGLSHLDSDPIGMFDADLVGFRIDHVERMIRASELGWDHVCGLRDHGFLQNPLQAFGPLITGERIVRRWIFDAVPKDCWDGYNIEVGINHACSRGGGRTCMLLLDGLTIRTKSDKKGLWAGLKGDWRMFSTIWGSDKCLDQHGRCHERIKNEPCEPLYLEQPR